MHARPNILFVVLDTARFRTVYPALRAGKLETLEKIAKEGTTFTHVTTVAPWTLPSHASLFTGEYTTDHGTHADSKQFRPETEPIAAKLRSAGYTTAGISANPWISPEFGFDRGFEYFSTKWDSRWNSRDLTPLVRADGMAAKFRAVQERPLSSLPRLVHDSLREYLRSDPDDGAERITDRATDWVSSRRPSPFFLFLNYIEPHLPYRPPAEYLPDVSEGRLEELNQDPWEYVCGDVDMSEADFRLLKALYRGELTYLDTQLERLYDALQEMGILDDTIVCVLGDHGENIGEHGYMGHQFSVHETLLHVPLLVRYPDQFGTDTEDDRQFESRDLFPTLLDSAEIDLGNLPDTVPDRSLRTDGGREFAIAEYVTPQPSIRTLRERVAGSVPERLGRSLRAIRGARWKLIEGSDGTTELYDLEDDPQERTDVSHHNEDIVAELQDELHGRRGESIEAARQQTSISKDSKARLEELGYL